MKRLLVVLIAAFPLAATPQATDRPEGKLESETANRIASLEKKFAELLEPTASEKQWLEACRSIGCQSADPGIREASERAERERGKSMDAVASQVHGEIDAYIVRSVLPTQYNRVLAEFSARQRIGHLRLS